MIGTPAENPLLIQNPMEIIRSDEFAYMYLIELANILNIESEDLLISTRLPVRIFMEMGIDNESAERLVGVNAYREFIDQKGRFEELSNSTHQNSIDLGDTALDAAELLNEAQDELSYDVKQTIRVGVKNAIVKINSLEFIGDMADAAGFCLFPPIDKMFIFGQAEDSVNVDDKGEQLILLARLVIELGDKLESYRGGGVDEIELAFSEFTENLDDFLSSGVLGDEEQVAVQRAITSFFEEMVESTKSIDKEVSTDPIAKIELALLNPLTFSIYNLYGVDSVENIERERALLNLLGFSSQDELADTLAPMESDEEIIRFFEGINYECATPNLAIGDTVVPALASDISAALSLKELLPFTDLKKLVQEILTQYKTTKSSFEKSMGQSSARVSNWQEVPLDQGNLI